VCAAMISGVHRDLLDWTVDIAQIVGAFGSLVAILLAARSITVAKQESAESNRRFIRERRLEFELEGLRELALMSTQDISTATASARFGVLAASLGSGVVPLAVAAARLPSTAAAELQLAGRNRDDARPEIQAEILSAIRARVALDLAGPGPGRRRWWRRRHG
jgi:hypothetical protein